MRHEAQRVLICDFNDEYGEFNVPSIDINSIPLFMRHPKKEIRRIRPFIQSTNGTWHKMSKDDMLTTLDKVTNIYAGGALLVEDINKYVTDTVMPPDFTGKLISKRHSDLDLILHYQSVARPLPIIWQNTNIIRYHNQMDSVSRSAQKLQDLTEIFQIAECLVDIQYYQNNNKRFFVYINRDTGSIIGNFTFQMFDGALEKFMTENNNSFRKYYNNLKLQGHKQEQAYTLSRKQAKEELFRKYYGNNRTSNYEEREARTMLCTGRQGVGKTWETMRYLKEEYCVNVL